MSARRKDVTLTREQIVEAALRVVDAEGLEALSMRRLGAELGVNPMATYHYVPNKSALYDLILDAVMSEIDLRADDASKSPAERLKAAMRAFRGALMKHPHAVVLLGARSPRTPAAVTPIDHLLGILFDGGLTPMEALLAVDALGQYVIGACQAHAHHALDSEMHQGTEGAEVLEHLPAEEFPNVARMMAEGDYVGWDVEFEWAIDRFVEGVLSESRPRL